MRKILSLCDYSGAWSQPYLDAGYNVIRVDMQRGGQIYVLCSESLTCMGFLQLLPVPVSQVLVPG